MSTVPRRLSDFVDPSGSMLGFLVPLFIDGRSNAPLVQIVSANGLIRSFEPYEVPEAPKLPAPHAVVTEGDPAVYAFAFGPDDIVVVTGPGDRNLLVERLNDPVLLDRPMLAVELAAFLSRENVLLERAIEVHRRLRRTSLLAADAWRDLSVLTTAIRKRMARSPYRALRRMADTIVVTARDGVVEVAGVPATVEPAGVEQLRALITDQLGDYAGLYPRPARGWRIELAPAVRRRGQRSEAAVLIASQEAVSRDWRPVLDLQLFWRDGPEYAKAVEETEMPLFVAFDAKDADQVRRARGDWTVRDTHGLAIGSSSKTWRKPLERFYGRVTHVVAPVIRASGSGRDRGVLAALELAIAAELDRVRADLSWPAEAALLLRAQGMGQDARSDGWAALYDRSWSLGLAPWRSLCIVPGGEEFPTSDGDDWAAHALLEAGRTIRGPAVAQVMATSRATGAMLIELAPREDGDFIRHRRAIVRLLEHQHWTTVDRDDGDKDIAIRIMGTRGDINLRFDEPIPNSRQTALETVEREAVDLRHLKGLVLTCAATPASTMAQINISNELAVDVRDLIGLDPRTATPLSVMGHQLRRMVMGLHSPSRTRFLAMLVRQAFEYGRVEASEAPALRSMIEDPELGSRFHLSVRTATRIEGATIAQMRLTDRSKERRTRLDPSGTFRMIVTPDEVLLEDRQPR